MARQHALMVIGVAGAGAAVVLVGLSVLHIYWALGGARGGAAAIPTVDGRPLISPSRAATLVVAGLLAVSAGLLIGGIAEWSPRAVFRLGCGGVGLVLLVRAIGDRRSVGFLKRQRGTEFARRDTMLYSPLCLALGLVAAIVGAAS
jgi:Protein of unknown function (DUF3995)